MQEIIRFVQNNPHVILYYNNEGDSLQIYTVYNELINIRPLKIKGKKNFYEVIVTFIDGTDCEYQAYTLNIIDVFRLLNDCINNFYRESYPEDEDLSDSENDDADEDIAEEEDEF